jgi:hypothetical protein
MTKQKLDKYSNYIAFTILALVLIFVLYWVIGWNSPRERELIKEGNEIVAQIETFKIDQGRLPENLKELGLPESEAGPLYYDKNKDGHNYTISFSGSSLGESSYYDSAEKTWHMR